MNKGRLANARRPYSLRRRKPGRRVGPDLIRPIPIDVTKRASALRQHGESERRGGAARMSANDPLRTFVGCEGASPVCERRPSLGRTTPSDYCPAKAKYWAAVTGPMTKVSVCTEIYFRSSSD